MARNRATTSPDIQRIGQAIARPGMDTRLWVAFGVVVDFKLDPDEGAFADVMVLSTSTGADNDIAGDVITARVGSFYAGPGFGFYAPLEADDEVIVTFPDGDFNQGGVVVARTWSASDPPADLAKNNDADICLQVKKDTNLRIQVFGSGNVVLGAENGKVLLGDETGTKPVHRKDDHEKASAPMSTWMGQVEGFVNGIVPGTVTPLSGVFATTPGIAVAADGSDKVESS